MNPTDPFERDRWGRPRIPHPVTGEPTAYQRVSTFAKALGGGGDGLATWKTWMALRGALVSPDIARQVAEAPKAPKALIEALMQAGGAKAAAQTGTNRHTLVAMALAGELLPDMTDQARSELQAVLDVVHDLGLVLGTEIPIVNDEWMVAGSCDLLLSGKTGPVVADLKTGKTVNPVECGIQLAAYARGRRWVDGGRGDFLSSTTPRLVVIHAPQTGAAPRAIDIDPTDAMRWGHLAMQVRDIQQATRRTA